MRYWIGKSFGTEVKFGVAGYDDQEIRVFTTRPDTLFGATYMVMSPEHSLVDIIATDENKAAIEEYKKEYGKMVFAKKVFAKKGPKLFFGLTGAPLGNHFCFHRYVTASICKMTGRPHMNEVFCGNLSAPLSIKTKTVFYIPARAHRAESKWLLTPLQGKGASDIYTPCSANAYIPFMGGSHSLAQGSEVKFEWIGGCR